MTDDETMTEIAPGILAGGRVRRVLKSGDPRDTDYLEAQEWIKDLRSRLSHIRGELEDVGRVEAMFEHDRRCNDVAGAMTLALIALNGLISGDRSFATTAERKRALWEDVAANPDDYVIEDGESWDWRPLGIFKRGG